MAFNAYKNESRKNWGRTDCQFDINELKLGALMRIADATEVMACEYQKLINDRDLYKRWYNETRDNRDRLARSNAALRGQITKLRKRLSGG